MAFFGIDDNDPEYQDFLTQYRRQTSAPKTGQNSGFVGDTVTGLKRGIQQLPGIATGLADIPAGMVGLNRPFSRGAEWLGEQTGFEPGKWQEQAQQEYSPALQQQRQEIEDTKGFFPTVGAYLARPRAAANLVAEALPGTVAGGFLGRAVMGPVMGAENLLAQRAALAAGGEGANAARLALLRGGATAGGIGEGAVTAGMQMEQTPDSVDPMRAAYTALGAGVGTGLIGRYSGNLATRMGIADPDTMIAAGAMPTARGAGLKGYAKSIGGGMLTEGVLEELPQSMQEQMWQNVATGAPLMRGVPEAGAAGMIAGGLMGAGANVVQRRPPGERPMPENAPTDLLGAPAAGQQLELPFEQPDIEGNDVVTRGMFNPFNRTGTVSDLNEGNPYSLGSAQGDLFEQQGEIEQYNPSEESARDYASQLQAQSLRAAIKANNYRLDGDEENAAYWENESNKLADRSVKAAKDFFKGATAARAVKAKGQKAAPLPTASPAYKPTEVEQAAMDSDIPDAAKVGLFRKDGKMRDHYAKQVMQWNDWADADLLNTHGVMAADFAAKKTIGTMEANRMSILEAVLRNRGVAFTSYAESSAARAAAAPVAGQGAAEAKANAKAPSAVTNIDPATYAAQIGAAPTIRPILPNLGMPTREEIAADMVANPDAYGPSQMTTPRDMLGGNTLPAAVSTPAGPGLAPVPVSTEPTLPAEVKLPKVQQRVFDHVVNAMQNDAIGTVVDAQGVFMIADIGRALNMKPGSVKMALKAIQPHLAKALGAGSVAEVKAQQGTRSVEEADATQLGLAPKEQRTNAIAEEDLFGGGEESAVTQGMGIVSGPGGSQANIFDGDEVKVPEAWLEPTEADKARDAKRAVDARKEADQALAKEARDKVKRAEEAMNTWNEYAESTTPLGTPFHELAERTMALWLLEYDALIEKHGHRSWAQLEPMIAKLYNEYATDTWVNQNEQGKIEATGRVRQPEKLLPAGEGGTRSPAAESQAAAPAVEAPAEQVTAEPAPVEVMDDDVADMWNEATAPLGMLSFNQLPDDLRAYLLQQPRTEAALNKRAQEVLDALTAETATMAADLDVAEEAAPAVEAPKAEAVEPAEPVVDKPAPVRKRVTASDKLKEQEAQRKADEATRIANETKRRADRASAEDKAQDQAETLASIVAEVVNGDTTRLEEGRALAGMQPDGSFKSPPNGMLMKTLANVRLMKIVDPKTLTNIPELLALLDTEVVAEKAPTGVKRRVVKKSVGQKEAGTNKDAVTTKLKKLFFNPDNFDKMVTVVQSIEDVPSEYRAGLPATTRGFIAEGKAYLIADNIPAGSELAVMLHELGSHIGMPKLLGAVNYARLVGHIYDWAAKNDNSLESRLAKKALARIRNAEEAANAPMSESDAHDELLAYFIEEAVENGLDPTAIKNGGPLYQWFRTLWAAAKVALRKIGLNRFDDITAQNIVDMAYGAAKLEITGTWHGTAADFRNFNHDYMGSGEGAQAYGWGTYLAQRPGIAKEYWKADVSRRGNRASETFFTYDGERVLPSSLDAVARAKYELALYGNGYVAADPRYTFSKWATDTKFGAPARKFYGAVADALKHLDVNKTGIKQNKPKGSMMRADVNVHDDEMLDWDKPLSEQSDLVKKALGSSKPGTPTALAMHALMANNSVLSGITGADLYKQLERITKSDKAASEYLDSIGIKGIRFLDQPSRAKAKVDIASYKVVPDPMLGKDARTVEFYNSSGQEITYKHQELANSFSGASAEKDAKAFAEAKLAKFKNTDHTRNLVIFNDKNIHRIYTEVGANPYDIKFSIGMTNNAAKAGFENQKAGAIAQLKEGANRALHLVAFTRDLVDIAVKEGLTSAANYYKLSNMRDAEQTRIESEVDRILTDAYKLSKGDRAAAQKFIKESTIAQKWGFMPDWKKEATVDPDFKKKFSALSKEAQTTVKNLFRHADTMHKQLQEQINAEIDREYDKRVKAALDAGNDSKAREIERDRKRALSVVGRKLPEMQGPYAPLKRFGNHVFVGKSQRYLDAERDNDKKEIARLIKLREGDYEVTFFDNKYQATVYARENQHRFAPNGTDVFGRQMGYDKFKEVPWGEILKIKTAIEAEPGDLKVKNAMQRLVTDLYISLLSDASARKTEMRREGVEGASDEMFRAFATKGRADAHFFAAMKHNGDIQRSISDMRLQTLGTPGEPPKPDVRARRARVFDEIIKRHDQQLNYTPTPFADKAMRFTSWWMLLTSPGYYIQNALQVGMLTLPVLAGSRMPGSTNPIGAKAAASALTRAYGKGLAKAVLAAGNTLDTEALEKRGMITPAERRMLDTLIMQGKIDITIAQDLGRAAAGEGFMDNMPYVGAGLRAIQNSAQRLEMLNRVVTALAAYRLTGDTEFAGKVIEDSHGNYTMSNAPRWMQGSSAARLLTQFRKFQLIQLSLLGRQVAALMDSKKPEEKAAAWATLRWIATTHGIMAGGLGLPVISQALSLLAPLFGLGGGDDEPEDVEGKLRKAIGNEDASNLLLRGVPAWMGMNMSGKVGMGNTFSVFPFLNTSGQAGYEKALVGMGGAAVATGLNMAKGADLIRDGEYYKGLELMLPKGVRDAMRAGRFANEGITNRRGDVLMTPDELSLFDIGTQGLGLPSTKLQERQRRVGQSIDYDTFYKERTTALRDNYAKAYRAGDQETLNEVRSDWRNMSAAMRANGLKPPPMSSLFKAPMEQRKRERDVVEGVQHTARTKKLVESAAAV